MASPSITMRPAHETRQDVYAGERLIGCVALFTIRGEGAWRFLATRKDIAARFPEVAPKHATPEAAFEFVRSTMGAA